MTAAISGSDLGSFLQKKPYAVIHVDAPWDGYRMAVKKQIDQIAATYDDVSFGYLDSDAEVGIATQFGVRNVPCVIYFRDSKMITSIIGVSQDIAANIGLMKAGTIPVSSNLLSRG